MKTPEIYRPTSKTVVTEIKQFIVDKVRRVAQSNYSVATRLTENTLTTTDVVVGPDDPYTLKDVHNIVSISCPHEITAEFMSFGAIPEPEKRTEQVYFDASIEIVGASQAGRFLTIRVYDADLYTPTPISVDVMNMRTGETEVVYLAREKQGVYAGFAQTQNNPAQGVDFDGVMYCRRDDILRVMYDEPHNANGNSQQIQIDVVMTLDFAETILDAPTSVPYNSYLYFKVKNPVTPIVTVVNSRTQITRTVNIHAQAPLLLGAIENETTLDVQGGDTLTLTTIGRDIYGQNITVTHEVIVPTANVGVSMEVPTVSDVAKPFDILVTDNNMPQDANVVISNAAQGTTYNVAALPEFSYSGRYRVSLPNLHNYALPGQQLVIRYTSGLFVVTKVVNTIMEKSPECEPVETDTSTVSAPVVFKINGLFLLNGSFAGTIKLSANKAVRCTLIKA